MSKVKNKIQADYRGGKERKVFNIGTELIRQANQEIMECQIEALELIVEFSKIPFEAVRNIQDRIRTANTKKGIGEEILNLLGEEIKAPNEEPDRVDYKKFDDRPKKEQDNDQR